jgi:hypothetical protein
MRMAATYSVAVAIERKKKYTVVCRHILMQLLIWILINDCMYHILV